MPRDSNSKEFPSDRTEPQEAPLNPTPAHGALRLLLDTVRAIKAGYATEEDLEVACRQAEAVLISHVTSSKVAVRWCVCRHPEGQHVVSGCLALYCQCDGFTLAEWDSRNVEGNR